MLHSSRGQKQVAEKAGWSTSSPTDSQAGPAAVSAEGALDLTDWEFEVLWLVAAGQSNREMAKNLFISSKTASVHVSNILSKLSVPSRGAAAAVAHRLRIIDLG